MALVESEPGPEKYEVLEIIGKIHSLQPSSMLTIFEAEVHLQPPARFEDAAMPWYGQYEGPTA
jgi:hypothetical protein